jgi:hypothetical protein
MDLCGLLAPSGVNENDAVQVPQNHLRDYPATSRNIGRVKSYESGHGIALLSGKARDPGVQYQALADFPGTRLDGLHSICAGTLISFRCRYLPNIVSQGRRARQGSKYVKAQI